jgi:hypothetical protein
LEDIESCLLLTDELTKYSGLLGGLHWGDVTALAPIGLSIIGTKGSVVKMPSEGGSGSNVYGIWLIIY